MEAVRTDPLWPDQPPNGWSLLRDGIQGPGLVGDLERWWTCEHPGRVLALWFAGLCDLAGCNRPLT